MCLLVSHISDIHLGYAQFNLQEREEDLYKVFEETIDISIKDHVDVMIISGDIFHNPKPNGASIIKLARELKKLKELSIPVYFILGEHDISRTNDVPIPFLFHNLGLARRLRSDQPIKFKDMLIYGFNKERRSNIDNGLLKPFKLLEQTLKNDADRFSIENKKLRKVLVLHQGLYEFNKFAGEIFSKDLPLGFDYYAMGHYHDHLEKRFPELCGGLVAYPGSIDLGHNEPISDVEKGFLIVDLSNNSENVSTQWIKLENRRPQMSVLVNYSDIKNEITSLIENVKISNKKPVLNLKIKGTDINPKFLLGELSVLSNYFLYYSWNSIDSELDPTKSSFDLSKDFNIDEEMSKLILKTLKSDTLTDLAMDIIKMVNNDDDGIGNENKIPDSNSNKQIVNYLWNFYTNNKELFQNTNSGIKKKEKELFQ